MDLAEKLYTQLSLISSIPRYQHFKSLFLQLQGDVGPRRAEKTKVVVVEEPGSVAEGDVVRSTFLPERFSLTKTTLPIQRGPSALRDTAFDVTGTAKSPPEVPPTTLAGSLAFVGFSARKDVPSVPPILVAACQDAIPGLSAGPIQTGHPPAPLQAEDTPRSSHNSLLPDIQNVVKVPPLSVSPPGHPSTPINRSFMDVNNSNEGEFGAILQQATTNRDGVEIGLRSVVCAPFSTHSPPRLHAPSCSEPLALSNPSDSSIEGSSLTETAPPVRPRRPLECALGIPGHIKSQTALVSPLGTALAKTAGSHPASGSFTHAETPSTPSILVEVGEDVIPGLLVCPMHRGLSPTRAQSEDASARNNIRLVPGKDPPIQPHPSAPPSANRRAVASPESTRSPVQASKLASRNLPSSLAPGKCSTTPPTSTPSEYEFTPISRSLAIPSLPICLGSRAEGGIVCANGGAAIAMKNCDISRTNDENLVLLLPPARQALALRPTPPVQRWPSACLRNTQVMPDAVKSSPGLPATPIARSFVFCNTASQMDSSQTARLTVAPFDAAAAQDHGAVPGALNGLVHSQLISPRATSPNPSGQPTLRTARRAIESSISASVPSSVRTPLSETRRAVTSPESSLSPPQVFHLTSCLLHSSPAAGNYLTTLLVSLSCAPPLAKPPNHIPPVAPCSLTRFESEPHMLDAVKSLPGFPSMPITPHISRQTELPSTPPSASVTYDSAAGHTHNGVSGSLVPLCPSALHGRARDSSHRDKSATLTPPHGRFVSSTLVRSFVPVRTQTRLDSFPARTTAVPRHGAATTTVNAALPWCSWEADVKRDAHGLPERLVHPWPSRIGFSSSLVTPPLPAPPTPLCLGPRLDSGQDMPDTINLSPPLIHSVPKFPSTPITQSFVDFSFSSDSELGATPHLTPPSRDGMEIGLRGVVCAPSSKYSLSRHDASSISALPHHPTRLDITCSMADSVKTSPELPSTLITLSLEIFNTSTGGEFGEIPRLVSTSHGGTKIGPDLTVLNASSSYGSLSLSNSPTSSTEDSSLTKTAYPDPTHASTPLDFTPSVHDTVETSQLVFSSRELSSTSITRSFVDTYSFGAVDFATTPTLASASRDGTKISLPEDDHSPSSTCSPSANATLSLLETAPAIQPSPLTYTLDAPGTLKLQSLLLSPPGLAFATTARPFASAGFSPLKELPSAPLVLLTAYQDAVSSLPACSGHRRLFPAPAKAKDTSISSNIRLVSRKDPSNQAIPSASLHTAPVIAGVVKSPPGLASTTNAGPFASVGFSARRDAPSVPPIQVVAGVDAVPGLLASSMHPELSPAPAEVEDTSTRSDIRLVLGKHPPVQPDPSAPLHTAPGIAAAVKPSTPLTSPPELASTPFARSFNASSDDEFDTILHLTATNPIDREIGLPGGVRMLSWTYLESAHWQNMAEEVKTSPELPSTPITTWFMVPNTPSDAKFTPTPPVAVAGCDAAAVYAHGAVSGVLVDPIRIGLSAASTHVEDIFRSDNVSLATAKAPPSQLRLAPHVFSGRDMPYVVESLPLSLLPPGLSSPPIDQSFVNFDASNEGEFSAMSQLATTFHGSTKIGVPGGVSMPSLTCSLSSYDTPSISTLQCHSKCFDCEQDMANKGKMLLMLFCIPITLNELVSQFPSTPIIRLSVDVDPPAKANSVQYRSWPHRIVISWRLVCVMWSACRS
ncbi:hypothetical protein Hypma_003340 [Hypsizygus marmoreus]|uniref:Uncharacterized protein n=1 Tax=Hypsizygus marmoreus TaxID=39966 RepID=A0A369J6G1_HYPMA|nr:hypothetical protein Hypma_003340 [Hypsizygus marmoreus]